MQLSTLMNDAASLNYETLPELRKMVEQYPFFHQARLLYLANLHQLHDKSFGEQLRKGSVFLPSAAALFHLTEGHHYNLEQRDSAHSSHNIVTEDEDRTRSLIDQFLANQTEQEDEPLENEPHALPTVAEVTTDYASFLLQDSQEEEPQLKGGNLIDTFISGQQGKQRYEMPELEEESEAYHAEALPDLEMSNDDTLYNEKIVEILVKQRQYDKALEILRKICLNNPEKNTNFATQLQLLEAIVEQKIKK